MTEVPRRPGAAGTLHKRLRTTAAASHASARALAAWLVVSGAVDRWPYLRAAGLGAGVLLATVARLR